MTRLIRFILVTTLLTLAVLPRSVAQEETRHALLFSKSTGFEHQTISDKQGKPNQVEAILQKMFEARGIELTATKDAGILNAADLAKFSLVVFYTQGAFDKEGVDGAPTMKPGGVEALVDWIKGGGGFVGFHSATDTLRSNAGDPATAYTNMIGAAFRGHGRQFRGTVRVVDPEHPTMASIPDGFSLLDEWYVFQQMSTDDIHVLALLDPGPEREKQKLYDIDAYPVAWCRELGKGRVFYNAMGHRPDVWKNETFLSALGDALDWAAGAGDAGAKPNYGSVVASGTDD